MATATADDVRLEDGNAGVIATDLSDAEIEGYIDDAAFEAGQAISDYDEWSTERQRQLEKYYAALLIRTLSDKAISSTSRETASVTYEGGGNLSVDQLRQKVDARDPSNTLAYNTDTDRYVGSTQR